MIEYNMRGITADELFFKVNPIPAGTDKKFEIKPFFSRRIQTAKENPKINIVILECKIESKENDVKPFNLTVRLVGIFEVNNMNTEDDRRDFAINATETMFPYLRAAVTGLTSTALINPLVLPTVSGATLFPDDQKEQYALNFDPKTAN